MSCWVGGGTEMQLEVWDWEKQLVLIVTLQLNFSSVLLCVTHPWRCWRFMLVFYELQRSLMASEWVTRGAECATKTYVLLKMMMKRRRATRRTFYVQFALRERSLKTPAIKEKVTSEGRVFLWALRKEANKQSPHTKWLFADFYFCLKTCRTFRELIQPDESLVSIRVSVRRFRRILVNLNVQVKNESR